MPVPDDSLVGVAIARRTGERRILTLGEYFELDRVSDAQWEFYGFTVDPETGAPSAAELEEFGFTPGGATCIPGDSVEVEPGLFQVSALDDTNPGKSLVRDGYDA